MRDNWKFKNGKATGNDETTGEMIKGGGERVVNWIWRLWPLRVVQCLKIEDML